MKQLKRILENENVKVNDLLYYPLRINPTAKEIRLTGLEFRLKAYSTEIKIICQLFRVKCPGELKQEKPLPYKGVIYKTCTYLSFLSMSS